MFKENLQAFVTALYNVYNDQLTEGFSQCSLIDSIEHSFVIYSDSLYSLFLGMFLCSLELYT